MDEALLRSLTPSVLTILVRRGADFAAAEDAVQDALVEALRVRGMGSSPGSSGGGDTVSRSSGGGDPVRDPKGWLVTVAWRRFLDANRADTARRRREDLVEEEPPPGPASAVDDTLQLYFLCAHPSLTPSSAVALTLRAVGGLTTRQIAQAYLVPEATMAQRISRAKRTVSGVQFDQPGDVATVLRVLYLVFNEGYSGDVDLVAEAIRLTRQLAATIDHPEVAGLLALMLLHHARRAARTAPDGSLVPLAEQDRGRWDTASIAEGVEILQAALARDRLGEFQAQAAIAALHADAPTVEETDWVQIVEWYDELLRLTDSPVVRLNRAVAVGEADGPRAGLAALAALEEAPPGSSSRGAGPGSSGGEHPMPRHAAVAAYLHERDGDLAKAARLYAEAARKAPNLAERDHLTRQAARLNTRRTR
ncbi:RNA polymerase subunit sigma-24 [Streptomyces nanshensis]|nr:RNA polymerase subunit sigma-24 [Streptomyces nanshensis]